MPSIDQRPTADHQATAIPPPVRAGVGLLAAGVERAKKVNPADLAGLPLRGIAFLASARETVERTYEELSNRGETVIARWRGRPEPRQTQQAPVPPLAEIADPFAIPEETAEVVLDATPGATLAHDQLPLEDYDHLTLGSLRARLPRLDAVALVQLLDYERIHANRLPVVTMLRNRIAKIGNDA